MKLASGKQIENYAFEELLVLSELHMHVHMHYQNCQWACAHWQFCHRTTDDSRHVVVSHHKNARRQVLDARN